MGFDIAAELLARQGEGAALWNRYLNPQVDRVLHSIGFDRDWRRGEGCYLVDADGSRYLDLLSGFGVFGIGRSHPTVRQALHTVLDAELADLVKMDTPLLAGLFAEALVARTPGLQRVYFCNSGTEAVEAALKFARRATGSPRVLFCDHAYHGLTAGSLSVNGSADFRRGFGPLLPDTKIPFGDIDALEREVAGGDVAALVVEPIQGKGVFVAPDGYLRQAQEVLHRAGALLICDEVQTGAGRTGRFYCYEHDGVTPDIVTVAKTLSGGFIPVGATITTDRIFKSVYSSMDEMLVHDTTFGSNAMAMTAGLATLSVLDDEGLIANAAQLGAKLLTDLRAAARNYELVADVRGRGLMIGIEFGRPRSLRLRSRWEPMRLVRQGLFAQMVVGALFEKHHILTQVSGDHVEVVKLLPPLTVTALDVDLIVDAFCSVMDAVGHSSRPLWHFGWGLASRARPGRRLAERPHPTGSGNSTRG